jgi:hypothetical protein
MVKMNNINKNMSKVVKSKMENATEFSILLLLFCIGLWKTVRGKRRNRRK